MDKTKIIAVEALKEALAEGLRTDETLIVTRNGQTLGYFIPAQVAPGEQERERLEQAHERLQAILTAKGIDPEDLIRDYEELKRQKRLERV